MEWTEEIVALGRLALPLVWNNVLGRVCDFTDCVFLGHLGALELGAAGLALTYMRLSSILNSALSCTLSILVSQSFGAHNKNLADLWFQRSLVLSSWICIFVTVCWLNTDIFLNFVNPEFAQLGAMYAYYSLYRIPAETLSMLLGSYLEAQQIVLPTVVSSCIGMAVNVLFNYLFIYGAWGYEGLGFIGSPVATTLTSYVVLAMELAVAACMSSSVTITEDHTLKSTVPILSSSEVDPLLSFLPLSRSVSVLPSFAFSKRVFNMRQLAEFIRLAIPQGLSQYMDQATFFVMGVTAASLGVLAVAANSIVLQIYELAACCFFAVAGAACIRIGNAVGSGRIIDGQQIAWLSVIIAVLFAAVTAVFVWFGRGYVPRMFTTDENVIAECALALFPAALALILDAIYAVVTVGILGGLGNTHLAAVCCATLAAVSPLAYVFAMWWGFAGVWFGWLLGTVVVSTVSAYFWQSADWELAVKESSDRADVDEGDLPT